MGRQKRSRPTQTSQHCLLSFQAFDYEQKKLLATKGEDQHKHQKVDHVRTCFIFCHKRKGNTKFTTWAITDCAKILLQKRI